jgi:hypothetical protein
LESLATNAQVGEKLLTAARVGWNRFSGNRNRNFWRNESRILRDSVQWNVSRTKTLLQVLDCVFDVCLETDDQIDSTNSIRSSVTTIPCFGRRGAEQYVRTFEGEYEDEIH